MQVSLNFFKKLFAKLVTRRLLVIRSYKMYKFGQLTNNTIAVLINVFPPLISFVCMHVCVCVCNPLFKTYISNTIY